MKRESIRIKRILKWVFYLLIFKLSLIFIYIVISLVLTNIIVNQEEKTLLNKEIYLSDNGVHVDLVIPEGNKYVSYGWGSEVFYLNVSTWDEFTPSIGFKAFFTHPESVMHVTDYNKRSDDWVKIKVTDRQFKKLISLIKGSFKKNKNGDIIKLSVDGYGYNDKFYKAEGRYSCFMTCNSWTNRLLKRSGIKASYWTPVNVGVVDKYK